MVDGESVNEQSADNETSTTTIITTDEKQQRVVVQDFNDDHGVAVDNDDGSGEGVDDVGGGDGVFYEDGNGNDEDCNEDHARSDEAIVNLAHHVDENNAVRDDLHDDAPDDDDDAWHVDDDGFLPFDDENLSCHNFFHHRHSYFLWWYHVDVDDDDENPQDADDGVPDLISAGDNSWLNVAEENADAEEENGIGDEVDDNPQVPRDRDDGVILDEVSFLFNGLTA